MSYTRNTMTDTKEQRDRERARESETEGERDLLMIRFLLFSKRIDSE